MSTSKSLTSEGGTKNTLFTEVLERLEGLRASRKAYGKVYFVSLCYALIAWIQGREFLILYLGVIVVVFLLHELSLRRVERQIDTVIETLQRLPKPTRDEE